MRCWRAESAAGSCRNVWYAAHDDAGTVGDYVNDLQRARRIVATQVDADLAAGRAAARLGLELRYTLVGAAVTTLAANVPAALVARLVRAGRWTVARGLGHARRLRDPVERAVALARLTPLVAVGPDGPDLVPELRAAAAEVTDPYRRAGCSPSLSSCSLRCRRMSSQRTRSPRPARSRMTTTGRRHSPGSPRCCRDRCCPRPWMWPWGSRMARSGRGRLLSAKYDPACLERVAVVPVRR